MVLNKDMCNILQSIIKSIQKDQGLKTKKVHYTYNNSESLSTNSQSSQWSLTWARQVADCSIILRRIRASNNFPSGASQIVWSNLFLLGHIPFLAGQTSIMSYRYKSAPPPFT